MSFDLNNWFKKQYLNEGDLPKGKWVDLSPEELDAYADDLIGLIQTAYSYIGGHSNYKTASDIGKEAARGAEYEVINLDDDPEPEAVNITKKKKAGTKAVATGHDGSKEAKRAVITHKIEQLKKPGFYVEVSGRIKDILLNAGVPVVTDEETIKKALEGKEIEMVPGGNGAYIRKIAGTPHEKILLGSPLV